MINSCCQIQPAKEISQEAKFLILFKKQKLILFMAFYL